MSLLMISVTLGNVQLSKAARPSKLSLSTAGRLKLIKHIVLSRTFKCPVRLVIQLLRRISNQLLHRISTCLGRTIGMQFYLSVLDSKMYGKPVPIYLNAFMTGRGRQATVS